MYHRRKAAVILFVIGILAAGGIGSSVFNRLDSGGYSNPNSDSYKVYTYINDTLKITDPTTNELDLPVLLSSRPSLILLHDRQ